MKKLTLLLSLGAMLCIYGCTKHENNLGKNKKNSSLPSSLASADDISVYNGMLWFADEEAMKDYYNQLSAADSVYDSTWVADHPGYSVDSLGNLEDSVGYTPYQPLIDFESQFSGYTSLRAKLSGDEATWLANGGNSMDTDPDEHFIVDDVLRTLINYKGEVRVGDVLYLVTEEATVEVYNADMDVLGDIESGAIDINANPVALGVYKTTSTQQDNCDDARSGQRDSGYEYNASGDRKIKWKLKAENVLWWHRVIGKVKGYKKKNNGNWKHYRSDLWVKIEGTVYEKDGCVPHTFFMTSGAWTPSIQTHSRMKEKVKAPFGGPICIKKNDVQGTFLGASGVVAYKSLTW